MASCDEISSRGVVDVNAEDSVMLWLVVVTRIQIGTIVRGFVDSSKEFLRENAAPLQQRVSEKLREDIPEKNPNTKA